MSRDLTRPQDQGDMWIYGQEPINVSKAKLSFFKFCSHRHYSSGDIMLLVCHVIMTWWSGEHLLDWFDSTRVVIPVDQIGGHKYYRNGDIKFYINFYLEKGELSASINHIVRFLKSAIPICNSEIPDTAGRKTRRRRKTQTTAKRYAFDANAII